MSWREVEVLAGLRGYVIPLTTPFTEDGAVDHAGVRHNVACLMDWPGCTGLYVGSVYQEFWSLTLSERKVLLELVVAEADGRCSVVAGVSAASGEDSLELAEHAQKVGASMLMAWPPIFGPRDDAGVLSYYERLNDAVDLPVCVYSTMLSELGFYISPELLSDLARLDRICAVKEASFDLTTHLLLLDELGEELAISTPFEEYWLSGKCLRPDRTPDFLMGSSRALYMQSVSRPRLAELFSLASSGRPQEALAKLMEVREAIETLQMSSFRGGGVHPIAGVKYATELLGLRGGPVRPPVPGLQPEEQRAIAEILARLGVLGDDIVTEPSPHEQPEQLR